MHMTVINFYHHHLLLNNEGSKNSSCLFQTILPAELKDGSSEQEAKAREG